MKLIKQMPEAEEKIERGTLSLSNASLLQKMITQTDKPLSKDEKLELINQIENKSRREAEKILGDAKIIYHIGATEETDEEVQLLRGLTAHKYKNMSELFAALVKLGLTEEQGLLPPKASLAKKHRIMAKGKATAAQCGTAKDEKIVRPDLRDLKCKRCGSNHAPQTEHIIPRAKGGTDDPKNLTLLCRNCNQRAAIREYGLKKMEKYLN